MDLPMPVRRIVATTEIKEDRNRVALQRGPLVYCFEFADNDKKAMNILLPDNISFTTKFNPELLHGVVLLQRDVPVPDYFC